MGLDIPDGQPPVDEAGTIRRCGSFKNRSIKQKAQIFTVENKPDIKN
jgi:hypothetical protein